MELELYLTYSGLYTQLKHLSVPSSTSVGHSTSALTAIIRLSALMYSSSVSNLSPISEVFDSESYNQFHALLTQIPLTHWKQMPGIFNWILFVACPACHGDSRSKALRSKMVVAGMAISLEHFALGTEVVRRLWIVQQWIKKQNGQ
jgi:hypothetical protein